MTNPNLQSSNQSQHLAQPFSPPMQQEKPQPPWNHLTSNLKPPMNTITNNKGYGSTQNGDDSRQSCLTSFDRPSPSGPLGRVSSRPTFVPCMQIDFEQVAQHVSRNDGTHLTADQLIEGLVENENHTHSYSDQQLKTNAVSDQQVVLNVEEDDSKSFQNIQGKTFVDEALVLRIHQDDNEEILENPSHPSCSVADAQIHSDMDISNGFAISIPVSHDPIEPCTTPYATSWYASSLATFSEYDPDEEDPLLGDDIGLDLSGKQQEQRPTQGTAIVQRHGARDVAEEQEVVCAVPNSDQIGSRTGLFIPVVDSNEDLTQLVLVVPPEQATQPEDQIEEPQTTAEVTREYVDSIANMIPSIVDVESTLEVRGTTENATVAINVTKQVSWVGYFILAIALFSVASQGTAVKWLPSVGGMIAAAWLMQTQTLLMIPFALFQLFTLNEKEQEELRKPSTLRMLAAASVAQVCWASGFFLSISYTTLFHAWSLNNIHAMTIVLLAVGRKYLLRDKTLQIGSGEANGARIAVMGVLLMQVPSLLGFNGRSILGDTIAAMSSLGAILFLDLCKELRNRIPLFLMMTPISAMNAILFSFASMIIFGTDLSMTDHGALGWMKSDRLALGLYLGGVVGFLGTVCCIAALKYLPKVVVGSVQTMMPVVGTVVAILAGVDKIPDFWTTCGGLILLYGVLMIADATRQSESVVVLNEHISEVGKSQQPCKEYA